MEKEVIERLTAVETEVKNQKEIIVQQHQETRDTLKTIFKKLDCLPCNGHTEKFKGINKQIAMLFSLVTVVIIGGIVFGIWIKQLK